MNRRVKTPVEISKHHQLKTQQRLPNAQCILALQQTVNNQDFSNFLQFFNYCLQLKQLETRSLSIKLLRKIYMKHQRALHLKMEASKQQTITNRQQLTIRAVIQALLSNSIPAQDVFNIQHTEIVSYINRQNLQLTNDFEKDIQLALFYFKARILYNTQFSQHYLSSFDPSFNTQQQFLITLSDPDFLKYLQSPNLLPNLSTQFVSFSLQTKFNSLFKNKSLNIFSDPKFSSAFVTSHFKSERGKLRQLVQKHQNDEFVGEMKKMETFIFQNKLEELIEWNLFVALKK
ncbi:Hypothetical_protein [Hexamita inflata]|uniref:Hypothetical_protein n=1 Tax=Hexamita inflata TaxID=28002 RepID=A0AA86U6R5_9EUKA|nr:Hypothetical protein HINF_LOCUS29101 [Hexamita inflata]